MPTEYAYAVEELLAYSSTNNYVGFRILASAYPMMLMATDPAPRTPVRQHTFSHNVYVTFVRYTSNEFRPLTPVVLDPGIG